MSNADNNGIHPYTLIPLPADAPFELREATEGKGWGAFATRRIQQGELILSETPMFVIRSTRAYPGSRHLDRAFRDLDPATKALVGLARENGGPEFTSACQCFIQNSFNVSDTELGFYLVQSRFNHSCQPNSTVPFTAYADTALAPVRRYALVDIEVGEEITFCYQDDIVNKVKDERHRLLHFECRCNCCMQDFAASRKSDMRRDLMAALTYMNHGVLPNGQIDDSDEPLVANRALKKQAEDRTMPITTQLVHQLWHVVVAEEEGIVAGMIHQLASNILYLARSLKTKRNIEIAELALEQETFADMFLTASRFLGEPDEGDDKLNRDVAEMRAIRIAQYLENNS
ncbi:hypothetical protein CEP51_009474 [Fusarium floridanum]|uniref:SET domain-containing protein n=1 Tax=Fusarium floridanum TaxID=1325733 RepID=A0A428RHI4_9HYPO|nr:hypothetical protein CEP51_009474 [Fusarium floridanum]